MQITSDRYSIRISDSLDFVNEIQETRHSEPVGAKVCFEGFMRGQSKWHNQHVELASMFLECYPAMVLPSIEEIITLAFDQWPIQYIRVFHRIGHIEPDQLIVRLEVFSPHRTEAFKACEFVMDLIKTKGPFWKKEISTDGSSHWVEAKVHDQKAADDWCQQIQTTETI